MLTAILLQSDNRAILAPRKRFDDPDIRRPLLSAMAFSRQNGHTPVWLFENRPISGWEPAATFTVSANTYFNIIDSPKDHWLIANAETLRSLSPQLDRLLIFNLPCTPESSPEEQLPEFSDPSLSGFHPQHLGGSSSDPILWTRQSAVAIIQELIAAGSCDLHLHTDQSDGTDSPEELVDRVLEEGLAAFAITDHDTLAALDRVEAHLEKRLEASKNVVRFVRGVELSIDDHGELHMLAYFPRGGHEDMQVFLEQQRKSRHQRNLKMIDMLQQLGYPISQADFEASGKGTIGRLQAAILLRDKGYFPNIRTAFSNLLNEGRPAYIERHRPSPAEAIGLIRRAGGTAVLAHPALYGWCGHTAIVPADLLTRLEKLKAVGLQGVEAFHGEATIEEQLEISAAAQTVGLIRTGGSDDHGANKDHARMVRRGTQWLNAKEILVVAALIAGQDEMGRKTWLLARRSSPGSDRGLWELPGGKVEKGETLDEALARELLEELGVAARIGQRTLVLTHDYPERRVVLVCLEAALDHLNLTLTAHDAITYVTADDALAMNLLPADYRIFNHLRSDARSDDKS